MSFDVLLISPSFPADNGHFTKALHELAGVRVLGVGDQPRAAMPDDVAAAVDEYLQVPDLWNEDDTVDRVRDWLHGLGIGPDKVECLWEPGVVLAARMRDQVEGVEYLNVEPIAFVGMGCRYPGGANDPAGVWDNLRSGVDAVREVPENKWNADAYYF